MKTIIELPDNLPPNGIGLALRAIADDILIGAVVPVPPFCYCIDTAVGLVTFWDSESDTLRDPTAVGNQTHPPLGTTLADFTAEQLGRLPTGSRFGLPPGHPDNVIVEKVVGGWQHVGLPRPPEQADALLGCRPLIRVGPEPKPTLASFAPEDIDKVCAEHRAYPVSVGPEQASETAPMYDFRITRDLTVERSLMGTSPWLPCPNAEVPAATAALVMKARREAAELAQLRGHHTPIPTPPLTPCGQVPRFTGQCPKHGDRCPTPSATLPDPWPKMIIEYATSTLGWARGTVAYAYADPDDPTYVLLETDDPNDPDDGIEWCAENIREVRTPDGVTLWKFPAGGAS